MTDRRTYLMAGGGTGGHLFPGIAVAEELQRRDPTTRVIFAGSERTLERDIVEKHGYEHASLPAMPSSSWKQNPFRFLWNNWTAFRGARELLKQERPAAVIGLGGFASAPLVIAAHRLNVPIILLEQNVVPGRATSWLARGASVICVSFAETVAKIPRTSGVVVTGNPVRSEIAALLEDTPRSERTLLILGGSQGSTAVNSAVMHAVKSSGDALRNWRIVHQTGANDALSVRTEYAALSLNATVEPFLEDMVECYRSATLVIARAGATTLAELACAGVPAILIPYPNAIGDHQTWNARAFEKVGAARIVEQHRDISQTAHELATILDSLIDDRVQLEAMRAAMRTMANPQAASAVVDAVLQHVMQESPA